MLCPFLYEWFRETDKFSDLKNLNISEHRKSMSIVEKALQN